ncbi:sigma-54-dependent transcriptional regulator [Alteromonas sp. a30]|uniref:sigma-54-dependent transcriptional regulator n=1 Tax=Alteromonas sp. a30 TaxID=2730917 RepID=UPI0022832149|nr:sigma-54 dependent transcriptional regulator [Alteromonas sp. a30]MCY7294435.1 sigma-54-dependent Fis family transcriptional regulator [Alteromonas sp. a30]
MLKANVMLVEDDPGLREALTDTLLLGGYHVIACDSAESALAQLPQQNIDIVISDIQLGGLTGLNLLQNIKNKFPNMPMLLMTAYATIDDAVQAMREGATDYLAKPFSPEVLLNIVGKYAPAQKIEACKPVVGDASSKQLLQLAQKVANTDATVMVLGPSGSGKEVLARYIHDQSQRNEQPFIAINCAAIPENMLEATLFGYEKGAFTGALQACPGKFEQAQGGTILLDEITEMDLALQAKLLRVLQEREVERLGGRKTISLDVRVIATSNRDLRQAVQDGVFREDLYYRLNVFPLTWLSLNQRPDDIVPLAEHLLERHAKQQGLAIPKLSASARNKLAQHQWPGNVRELENLIQRALILSGGQQIEVTDLMLDNSPMDSISIKPEVREEPQQASVLGSELRQQEHQIILDTLASCNGSRKQVAEKLGISPRTLRYKLAKMRDMGIELPA